MKSKFAVLMLILLSAMIVFPVFGIETGEDAPPFVLTDIEKNYVFSKKLYGTGWILIDFYATWCENCNKELPYVESLFEEFSDTGFQVMLLVTDDEGHSVVRPYFAENPTPLTILVDKYKKAVEAFEVKALPSLFLINPEAKVVFSSVGYHEEDIERIRVILSEALNE